VSRSSIFSCAALALAALAAITSPGEAQRAQSRETQSVPPALQAGAPAAAPAEPPGPRVRAAYQRYEPDFGGTTAHAYRRDTTIVISATTLGLILLLLLILAL
jgi:hypothetical protein